jgi:2-succinyl-5-enolpyruvyl-6-hydroxy-3-cyclohexene-1-carboxylate synthase
MSAAVQTLWAELITATLIDAGVATCVVSPGSRSTPLVAALPAELDTPTIIDERAAAFFALGVGRATGRPAALLCTSGSAAAHYFPAIVEANLAGVPLVVITADRPPELHGCGASQTMAQHGLYGGHVRGAFELGAPAASAAAFRGVRRTIAQAVALARGPHPGPVHINVALRKPLEPAAPTTAEEHALAQLVAELRAQPIVAALPRLVADHAALVALAAAIAAEPRGLIIAGAAPASHAALRDAIAALAARAGYPVLAEAGSQLRFAPRGAHRIDGRGLPAAVSAAEWRCGYIDHGDLLLAALTPELAPKLIVQLGAEPVAAGWVAARARLAGAAIHVLADHAWHDPESSARSVIIGDVGAAVATLADRVPARGASEFASRWRAADAHAAAATDAALAGHPRSEGAVLRAALAAVPAGATIQIGNSLPIRVVDQVCAGDGASRTVLTQRGVAGIDGLIASAAGATRAGQPVLLVLGDVSFAHDLGGVLAARAASAPLAILVIDNGGGQIFAGLPIARAALGAGAFDRHFTTAPGIDPAAVAIALGARGTTAPTPAAAAAEVATALATPGVTVIVAPVTPAGAHDVRRAALELYATSTPKGLP